MKARGEAGEVGRSVEGRALAGLVAKRQKLVGGRSGRVDPLLLSLVAIFEKRGNR